MANKVDLRTRLRALFHAWPWPGALFLIVAFAVTAIWFLTRLLYDLEPYHKEWFEPLAAIVGGVGAFLVAAVLIFRRIEQPQAEAEIFSLARGLATGYYFNFVQPLIKALRDPGHSLHEQARIHGARHIAGLVVGFPQTESEFRRGVHGPIMDGLSQGSGDTFAVFKLAIGLEDHARSAELRLAVNAKTGTGVLLDIPTTLVVIPEFARHVARSDPGISEHGHLADARLRGVIDVETAKFGLLLEEFERMLLKAGADERPQQSPVSLLHLVPVKRLRRRVAELTDA